jgi:hypothetical protein
MKPLIIIATITVLATNCTREKDGCEVESIQCADGVLEICDSETNWQEIVVCADLEPGEFVCGEDADGEPDCVEIATEGDTE